MSAAFDTLAAVRDMEAAGMERKAAEAVAGDPRRAGRSCHQDRPGRAPRGMDLHRR